MNRKSVGRFNAYGEERVGLIANPIWSIINAIDTAFQAFWFYQGLAELMGVENNL